jgi:two-component system chemotaxis response regulator CheY
MKALVVDDSRAIRVILSQMLGDLGFEVSEARHGCEALLHLQTHTDTDLALIDWNMPEMNGLELVQAVHADPRLGAVRMMMVTTEVEMSQMVRALDAGAHEYIMKPFTRGVVESKLQLLGLPLAREASA